MRNLTEDEVLAVIQSRESLAGRIKLTYDSGPYDITRPTDVAMVFAQAIQQMFSKVNGNAGVRDSDDDEPPIIEAQLIDLTEGLGASEDHEDAIAFFTRGGISDAAARKLVAVLALHRFVPVDVLRTYSMEVATPKPSIGAASSPINESQTATLSLDGGVNLSGEVKP
jgi:hypothetical protein